MSLYKKSIEKFDGALEIFAPVYEKLFYFPGDKENHLPRQTALSHVTKSFIALPSGEKISIWHLKANQLKGRLIHCHGSGYNISSHYPHVSWLIDHGYEVIMFDYPGYGESDGKPTRSSTVSSAKEVIFHFLNNAPRDLPVFVLGQSLGGNIASVALTEADSPKGISGVILDSMYSSFRMLGALKIQQKYLPKAPALAKLASAFISNRNCPLSRASRLNFPTLIIHSRNDGIVPYQESLHFYNQMSFSDVEFWSHLNSGHTEVLQHNINDFQKKLVEWMASKAKKR